MLVLFFRIIKFAFQNFWRNIWLSFATITILVLALFSINFLLVMNVLSDETVAAIENRIDVSVYLKKDIEVEEIRNFKNDFERQSYVKEVSHISAEEALESFKIKHQDDLDILASIEELDENPLGPSLIIKAHNAEDYPKILAALEDPKYEDLIDDKDFDDHQALISRITRIKRKVQETGGVVSLIFIAVAVLVVFNTIRVAIYTHRKEIEVMKLVGATNWFIRAPFMFEALIFAVLATGITMLVLYPILNFMQPHLTGFFAGHDFNLIGYFTNNLVQIFGLELLAVSVLNILSTSMAIGKYFRV